MESYNFYLYCKLNKKKSKNLSKKSKNLKNFKKKDEIFFKLCLLPYQYFNTSFEYFKLQYFPISLSVSMLFSD